MSLTHTYSKLHVVFSKSVGYVQYNQHCSERAIDLKHDFT